MKPLQWDWKGEGRFEKYIENDVERQFWPIFLLGGFLSYFYFGQQIYSVAFIRDAEEGKEQDLWSRRIKRK